MTRMRVAELLAVIQHLPPETPITLSVDDVWVPLTRAVVGEVSYSNGPGEPAQRAQVEVTLS